MESSACSIIRGLPVAAALIIAASGKGESMSSAVRTPRAPARSCAMKSAFRFQRLPAIGIEAAPGDVTEDLDFLVLVPLPQDAAVALLDIGGPPGRVEMVHGYELTLDVGADAHFGGRADQDANEPLAHRRRTAWPF